MIRTLFFRVPTVLALWFVLGCGGDGVRSVDPENPPVPSAEEKAQLKADPSQK